jgi:hypothetical protein
MLHVVCDLTPHTTQTCLVRLISLIGQVARELELE